MWLIYLLLSVIAFFVLLTIIDNKTKSRRAAKIARARIKFDDDRFKYGLAKARAMCPHEITALGQTGVPGVVTLTTEWCAVCGDLLPPKQKT